MGTWPREPAAPPIYFPAMKPSALRLPFVALVLSLILSACSDGGTPVADVAASVTGTVITNAQVDRLGPTYKALSQQCKDEADCNRQVLAWLIQAAAVRTWAEDNKQLASASDINAFMDQVNTQAGGEEKLRATLAEAGGTLQSFQDLARAVVIVGKVQQAMGQTATDAQLQATYDATKNSQLATMDTAHILVDSLSLAQQVKDEATPTNFADLAKKYSKDTASAAKGGELGPMEGASLVPSYADAVGAAVPGTIIGPVKSPFGYHVIWVKSVDVPAYDAVKDKVASLVFDVWLTKLLQDELNEGELQVNPRYGRFDPVTRTVEPITTTAVDPGTGQQSNLP